jgi:hypothetical protein
MRTPVRLMIFLAVTLSAVASAAGVAFAQPVTNQRYVWFGQVVLYDQHGKTVTVKAPYRPHVNRYIGEFKRGDKVMLTWGTPDPGETEAIIYVGRYEASSGAKWGYVLPADFVSADTTEHSLTFAVAIPSKALKVLKTVPSGGYIKVTTPFDQPDETATIVGVEASDGPPKPISSRSS